MTDQELSKQSSFATVEQDAYGGPSVPQQETRNSVLPPALRVWIHPFSRVHKIPVVKRVWVYLACMAVYASLVEWITDHNFPSQIFKDLGGAAYTSVILGLLLVFRTNAAYDRWWEGRKLWGQLVNDSRNLCLKVRTFVPVSPAEKARFGELVISFAYGLKHHLRDSRPTKKIPGLETDIDTTGHIPVSLTGQMYEMVQKWQKDDLIDGWTRMQLDAHLKGFMDVCGGCERIRSTPLAVSYRAFLRQGIVLNLLALPWYVPREVAIYLSLPVVLIGSYFLIGLELIAEDIEDPFGDDGDDLPLDYICEKIQATISEILTVPKQQFTAVFKTHKSDPLKGA